MSATSDRSVVSRSSGGTGLTAAAVAVLAVSLATSRSDPAPDVAEDADLTVPQTTKSGILARIDLFQQTRRPVAFTVGVVKRFGDDRAAQLAALIAYYGFFSLFPAMLAMVTILGFVLDGRPDLRTSIANSALAQFPVIGDSIGEQVGNNRLGGNVVALVIGLAAAAWAGLGAMQAAQDAMNRVWGVSRESNPAFLAKRLRSLAMVIVIVIGLGGSSIVSQFGLNVVSGIVATISLFAATAAINVLMYLVAYRLLTVAHTTWTSVARGAAFAGIAYSALQVVGTAYVTHTLKGAKSTYGTFGAVIGLLSWIYLIAQITMFGAEVNVVRATHAWPRSLFTAKRLPAAVEPNLGR